MSQVKLHPFARRIFWDGYGLDSRNTGIYRYAEHLARDLTLHGLSPRIISKSPDAVKIPGIEVIPVDASKLPALLAESKIFWPGRVQQRLVQLLTEENRGSEAVILHGLSNLNLAWKHPATTQIRKVVTLHDLIPLLVPRSVSRAYYQQFKFLLPRVLAEADRIICVSNWTARGVSQLFPNYVNKILVIPNGISPFDKLQKFEAPPLGTGSKLKLVSVSRYEPYKEFNLLKEILFKRGNDFSITLVTDQNGQEWARREASSLISSGYLKVITNISDEALKGLYRNAHAMIHPSLFEGFCLPAAECLSSGTPVVYRGGSGIDETVGNTVGVPINANASVFDWISGIEYAANLKFQQKFIRELANHIDAAPKWADAGEKLRQVYEELLA
jgi:glycosyltransferase involved in cell wall biosynthesis